MGLFFIKIVINIKIFKYFLVRRNKNFKKLCKKFRNVQLECAPKLIKKYNENKSYCDSKQKKFFWTLKFNFLDYKENISIINLNDISNEKDKFISTMKKNNASNKVIELQNFQSFSYLFDQPIDDSVNNFFTLYEFLFKNKDKLNFDTLCILNKHSSENIEDLIVLMRINFVEKDKIKENDYNRSMFIYKIKDSFYREIDKNMLIKEIIENNVIHEYPEFEIFNKKILDKIFV